MGYCTIYNAVKNELFDENKDSFQDLDYPEKDEIFDLDRGLAYHTEFGKFAVDENSPKWLSIAGMGRNETKIDTGDNWVNLVSPSDVASIVDFFNSLNVENFESFVESSKEKNITYNNYKWAYEEFGFLREFYNNRIKNEEWVIIDVG